MAYLEQKPNCSAQSAGLSRVVVRVGQCYLFKGCSDKRQNT
jgi:hypothetical protein